MNFSSPFLSWQRALVIAVLTTSVCLLVRYSQLHDFIEQKIIMPINFQVRAQLGQGPGLDPRIKIFSMDDEAYGLIGDHDLSYKEWADTFKAFSNQGAKAIVVDKFFDAVAATKEDAEYFNKTLSTLNTPVYAGVWFHKKQTQDSETAVNQVTTQGESIHIYSEVSQRPEFHIKASENNYGVFKKLDLNTYGPTSRIQKSFHGLGHFSSDINGQYKPIVRIKDDYIVPHIALLTAAPIEIKNGRLFVNNHHVPVTASSDLQVNIDSYKFYKDANFGFRNVLRNIFVDSRQKLVEPGDTVLILPAMATGRYDIIQSPLGEMPGGFLVAAMLNSTLTGKWLNYFPGELLWITMAALLAGLFTLLVNTFWLWVLLLSTLSTLFISGMIGFSYFETIMPWFYPSINCFICGIFCLSTKSKGFEQNAQRLTSALQGVVSADRLQRIIKTPSALDLKPKSINLSIIFVDIVGFSIIAERLRPEEVFSHLKQLFSELGAIVHAHGGIVDSTPGDGMLAYFGHQLDGTPSKEDHALQALNCALAMQQRSVERILESTQQTQPALPLRIGLNSDYVFLGDLGGTLQIKPTVIGHAVNLAKRLESACDFFRIMVGYKTRKHLIEKNLISEEVLCHRPIHIKHHAELIEAYEIDPFTSTPQMATQAMQIYREGMGIERESERFAIPKNIDLRIVTEYGQGRVINFSETGLAVLLSDYLGKDVQTTAHLNLNESREKQIPNFTIIVKWGRPHKEGFMHGLSYVNLNHEQKDRIFTYLKALTRQQSA